MATGLERGRQPLGPDLPGRFLVAAVDAAKASVDQAKAILDVNVQAVQSAVDQAYYGKTEAAERIAATQKLIGVVTAVP